MNEYLVKGFDSVIKNESNFKNGTPPTHSRNIGFYFSKVGVYMKKSIIDKYSTFDRQLKEKINE